MFDLGILISNINTVSLNGMNSTDEMNVSLITVEIKGFRKGCWCPQQKEHNYRQLHCIAKNIVGVGGSGNPYSRCNGDLGDGKAS